MRYQLPLAVVFASLTQGCWFWGKCGDLSTTDRHSLDAEAYWALVNQIDGDGTGDTGDTGDVPGGLVGDVACADLCDALGSASDGCGEVVSDEGDVYAVECTDLRICIGGRLHQVVQTQARGRGTTELGAHLAQMAHDEWASVAAFQALQGELRDHGAPQELRRRVLEAAEDEVRHAKSIAKLARAHGGVVPVPVIVPGRTRTLEVVATENVVEAVVLETWAALRATLQSKAALDPAFREVMVTVAADETRHAELARDLDSWFRGQLDLTANDRLDRARDEALAGLRRDSEGAMTPALRAAVGWPSAEDTDRLLRGLVGALWA